MPPTLSEARIAKRRRSAPNASKFQVAVIRKKLISPSDYEFCELIDISYSGIGLASPWLKAKVGQKLRLEILHGRKKYAARGIVARISSHPQAEHYGIVFVYAPPELDHLIRLFIQEHHDTNSPKTTTDSEQEVRARANRIAIRDAQVYAKQPGLSDPFVLCHVDNISKTGMGFFSPRKLDKSLPFPISMRISLPPQAAEITGTVHHISKKTNGYYYGMEYDLVPMEFVRLLETLEA